MLSGNGRHRRPRQAPAFVVAAGVTGSAIAIPLLGATGASAADGTTWDRVAECESGGSWSASTGNGYFGGLQISQQDWDSHGGLEYATTPDQASRSQQIAVAEKILADRGTTPWATCALLSGLTSGSGSVGVDTGVTDGGSSGSKGSTKSSGPSDAQKPLDSTDSPGESGSSGSSDSSSSSDPAASGAETSPSVSPSPSESAGRDAGDGRTSPAEPGGSGPSESGASPEDGSPTEEPESAASDNSWRSGASWSLVDTGSLGGGRHRGDSADENGASGTADQGSGPSGRHAYTVRAGDTLASIADSLDVDGGWRALYAANEKAIGADPNHIAAGQTLDVGVEAGEK